MGTLNTLAWDNLACVCDFTRREEVCFVLRRVFVVSLTRFRLRLVCVSLGEDPLTRRHKTVVGYA